MRGKFTLSFFFQRFWSHGNTISWTIILDYSKIIKRKRSTGPLEEIASKTIILSAIYHRKQPKEYKLCCVKPVFYSFIKKNKLLLSLYPLNSLATLKQRSRLCSMRSHTAQSTLWRIHLMNQKKKVLKIPKIDVGEKKNSYNLKPLSELLNLKMLNQMAKETCQLSNYENGQKIMHYINYV